MSFTALYLANSVVIVVEIKRSLNLLNGKNYFVTWIWLSWIVMHWLNLNVSYD